MKKSFFTTLQLGLHRNLIIMLIAIIIDAVIGDPQCIYKKFPHPVMWIGKLINFLDHKLNVKEDSTDLQKRNGFYALFIIISVPGLISYLLQKLIYRLFPFKTASILIGLISSIFIAQRSLYKHVNAVKKQINKNDLDQARLAVRKIVGRETKNLDQSAICRAAIESLAENFSDGVIAPILWGCIGGLPGMVIYKAINTADSMIGHLSRKYRHFGYASAKMDDYINYPAARLSAVYILLLINNNFIKGLKFTYQDAKKHNSPNAGWPEAAMAHCLKIQLAGPRHYKEYNVDTPTIGKGRKQLNGKDIEQALIIFCKTCFIKTIVIVLIFIVNQKTNLFRKNYYSIFSQKNTSI